MIDQELLDILACPACKAAVRLAPSPSTLSPGGGEGTGEGGWLVCTGPACGLRYPIRDGIPVMLVEEAEKPARP